MHVTLRLFAVLRERVGVERLRVDDLPEGLDVTTLKRSLEERHPELGPLDHVRAVVGTSYVPDSTALADGQEVSLLPPVSGGAPKDEGDAGDDVARGAFELRVRPLDPREAWERVAHDSCGAVVLFTGTTRERNRDRDVVHLDYTAFDEMAGAEMRRVFDECLAAFGPGSHPEGASADRRLRMLVLHRTGRVEVGEPSVVVAVASPHRDAAYAASRFLIDELKARVPLWKKETYEDGHHWIGDRS